MLYKMVRVNCIIVPRAFATLGATGDPQLLFFLQYAVKEKSTITFLRAQIYLR